LPDLVGEIQLDGSHVSRQCQLLEHFEDFQNLFIGRGRVQ
jgi:hypothetical protein